jgi:IS30 family transposase
VKESENGRLVDFERGQIVSAHLAGASVTEIATLLGVLRVILSKAMSACANHGKTTTLTKRNSGWKSRLTETDRRTLRIVSKKITELLQHR